MSVEHEWKRRSTKDEHPSELVLTITITGAHDIYRFAHHMLTGQVEFCGRGIAILSTLKRRMGKWRWNYMDRSLGGWIMRGEKEPKAVES